MPAVAKQKIASDEPSIDLKDAKEDGINPQWSLLIGQPGSKSSNERSSSGKNDQDEGDVGSTRQTKLLLEDAKNQKRLLPKGQTGNVKKNWIKVRHNLVTKRMNNIPVDLDELKIFLWNRFGELKNYYANPGSLQVSAELPRSTCKLEKSQEGDNDNLMLLSTSEDLQSFIQ